MVGFALQKTCAVSDEVKVTILDPPATQACLLNTLLPLAATHVMTVLSEFKQNKLYAGTDLSVNVLQMSTVLSLANCLAGDDIPGIHYDVIRERLNGLLEIALDRQLLSVVKYFLKMMRLGRGVEIRPLEQALKHTAGEVTSPLPDTILACLASPTNSNMGLREPVQLPSNKPGAGLSSSAASYTGGTNDNTGAPTQTRALYDNSGALAIAFNVQQHLPLTTENMQLSNPKTLRGSQKCKGKKQVIRPLREKILEKSNYGTIAGQALQQQVSCTSINGQNNKENRCDDLSPSTPCCMPRIPTSVSDNTSGMKFRLNMSNNMEAPRAGNMSRHTEIHMTDYLPVHNAIPAKLHTDSVAGYKHPNVSSPCQHDKYSLQSAADT